MSKTTTQQNNIVTILIIAAIVVVFILLLANMKQSASQVAHPSPTPAPYSTSTEEPMQKSEDSDVKSLDAEFNKIKIDGFNDTELSNTTLGL